MVYPINTTVPAAPNDPLDDVEPMRTNFANISSYLAVDHVAAGATTAGYHKRITFDALGSIVAPSGFQSSVFTSASLANASAPNVVFQNATNAGINNILNCVRGFGIFQGRSTNGACTLLNGVGISAVRNATGDYTVTINAGLLASANYLVQVTSNSAIICGYSISGSTTCGLTFKALSTGSATDPTDFSVSFLQN